MKQNKFYFLLLALTTSFITISPPVWAIPSVINIRNTFSYANNLLTGITAGSIMYGGVSLNYGYDSQSRLQTVTDNQLSGNKTTTYTYKATGSLESCLYPNNVKQEWTYNNRNRLTNLTIKNLTTNTVFNGFAYTVGVSGNRTKVVEENGRTIDWTYDNLYRLTEERITNAPSAVNGQTNWTYDKVGNRQTQTSTITGISNQDFTNAYDENDRLLAENYTYTEAGATLTNDKSQTFTYDAENHLLSVTAPGVSISYKYDGEGNRIQKTNNITGEVTRYLTDSNNPTGYSQVLLELDSTNTIKKRYTYGLDLISQTNITTNETNFYGYDGQGSTRILTDINGNVTDTYDYEAFGKVLSRTGTTNNNYLFHGEQYDEDLGLYYLRARYMDGDIGRFVSMDEFEGESKDVLSLHKYLFTSNNSVNKIDPSGLFYDIGSLAIGMNMDSVLRSMEAVRIKTATLAFDRILDKILAVGIGTILLKQNTERKTIINHYATFEQLTEYYSRGVIYNFKEPIRGKWFTPDYYISKKEATSKLALPGDKDVGISLVIYPVLDGFEGSPTRVLPYFNQPGGGLEWNTKHPIPIFRITSAWPLF